MSKVYSIYRNSRSKVLSSVERIEVLEGWKTGPSHAPAMWGKKNRKIIV